MGKKKKMIVSPVCINDPYDNVVMFFLKKINVLMSLEYNTVESKQDSRFFFF